jgi:sugar-phosphatase
VLVDSRRAVELSWHKWATERGVEIPSLLARAQGRRTVESLKEFAPHLDLQAEVARLEQIEAAMTEGVYPVPGAREIIEALHPSEWAIVTSGSDKVALTRMGVCGIPTPQVFVSANDLHRGKPDPEGYLTAARKLAVAPQHCVVVEDTRVGVIAGKAGGMKVLAIEGTENRAALEDADAVVKALGAIRIHRDGDGRLEVSARGGVD